jgi:hypothetical protein
VTINSSSRHDATKYRGLTGHAFTCRHEAIRTGVTDGEKDRAPPLRLSPISMPSSDGDNVKGVAKAIDVVLLELQPS